jgi:hypothetical protein
MMLHFDVEGVRKLVAHAKAATKHGATYGQEPPIGAGLWLVGDHGVYLMSNGLPGLYEDKSDHRSFVVYAREIDPSKFEFDTWYERKRAWFGGDDGCEFLPIEDVEAALKLPPWQGTLAIDVTPRAITLTMMK